MLQIPDWPNRSARWLADVAASLAGRARAAGARVPVPVWGYGAVFFLFAILYRVTATRDYTFDSVSYALQIERFLRTGELAWLFHPHHMLFNPAGLVTYRVLRALGFDDGTLGALQVMNALLGAAGVALFAWTAGRICRDRGAGLLAGAGLGLSYGYWTCATDGRVNTAGVVVLVGVLAAIAALLEPDRVRDPRAYLRRAALLGALQALAILLHQSHALVAPAALLAILLSPAEPRRHGILAYLGGTLGLVAISYLLAARLATGETGVGATVAFATTYAQRGQWWSLDIRANLARDVDALVHAVLAQAALSGDIAGRTAGAVRAVLVTLALSGAAVGASWWGVRRLVHRAARASDGPEIAAPIDGRPAGSQEQPASRRPVRQIRRACRVRLPRTPPTVGGAGPLVSLRSALPDPRLAFAALGRVFRSRLAGLTARGRAGVRHRFALAADAGDGWSCWRERGRRRLSRLRARPLPWVLGVWVAAYAGFFTVWNPGYFVFWVPVLLPLWLLIGRSLTGDGPVGARPARWLGPAMALLALVANNVVVGVAPHARPEENGRLRKALAVRDHTRPGDVLVIAAVGDDADAEVYIPYFARRDVIPVGTILARAAPGMGLVALRSEIERVLAAGRRVFVHEELLSSEGPYVALRSRHGLTRGAFIAFLHRHYRLGPSVHWRAREVGESR